MSLAFSTRISEIYTLTVGQTGPFTQAWPLYAAGDLEVRRQRGGNETLLVLEVDYTVSGAGPASTGFAVTLLAAAQEGDRLVLAGARPVSRAITYTAERAATPGFLNIDLDTVYAQLQEMAREVARAFRTSLFSPTAFDFGGRRLTNVAPAEADGDVVTKGAITSEIAAVLEAAEGSSTAAEAWASKMDGPVAGGEYSAKYRAGQAATAAGAASAAQGAAEGARDTTLGARDTTLGYRNAAADILFDVEAARDQALAAGNVFDDTADGLAGTSTGDYFLVPSGDDDESFILYRHDSGPAATEIKRLVNNLKSRAAALCSPGTQGTHLIEVRDVNGVPYLTTAVPKPLAPAITALAPSVWWDFSDLRTLFSDNARTTPITLPHLNRSQDVVVNVRGVTDLSGNGFHLDADDVNNSAALLHFAGRHAIRFNGIARRLRCNAFAAEMSGTDVPFTVAWSEYDPDSAGTEQTRWAFGNASSNSPRLSFSGNAAGLCALAARDDANTQSNASLGVGAENVVQRWVVRHTGTAFSIWLNGVRVAHNVAQDIGARTFDRFTLGAQRRMSIDAFGELRFGELMFWAGEALTLAEVADVNHYLASRWTPITFAGEVDVIMVAGQSNAEGRGTGGPKLPPGRAFYYDGTFFSPLTDPVGGANLGSAWPAFARRYYELTGRRSVWIEQATSDTPVVTNQSPNWDFATGTLYPAARDAFNAVVAAIEAAGGSVGKGFMLWVQGEADATYISNGTATQSDHQNGLEALFAGFKANCPRLDRIVMAELGARVSGNYATGFTAVRAAQAAAAAALSTYVHLGYTGAKGFVAAGKMTDDVHYSQAGLNDLGEGLAVYAAGLV